MWREGVSGFDILLAKVVVGSNTDRMKGVVSRRGLVD